MVVRLRHPLVVALLVAVAAAGCVSGKADPTDAASAVNAAAAAAPVSEVAGGSSVPAESGCGGGAAVTGRPLIVATTVAPITSIIGNLTTGTDTVVTGLVPEGTNSHTFEPPPSAAKTVSDADIVFINGLKLEEPTKDLATTNAKTGSEICELGTAILPESEWIFDFSFPKDGGKPNPHLWTNPPMAKEYARVAFETLAARDPDDRAVYERNYVAYAAKIDTLDAAMVEATASVPAGNRRLLTYHDAYAYFAKHYGWEVVGAIQPSSFDEPTAKEVAGLIEQIEEKKVPAIFGSEVFPSPVLEQIGKETGAKYVDVLRDDDLPGAPGDPDHSFLGLMRFDYVTMVGALGGDASGLKALDMTDVGPDTAKYPQ